MKSNLGAGQEKLVGTVGLEIFTLEGCTIAIKQFTDDIFTDAGHMAGMCTHMQCSNDYFFCKRYFCSVVKISCPRKFPVLQ